MPHIHEKYDFVIVAVIVFKDKVLLVNHPRYNKWIPVGGHVELDEDTDEALFREVSEETGLEVEVMSNRLTVPSPEAKPLYAPNYMETHEANAPHRHIGLIYFARSSSASFKKSAEHTDMRWFSDHDLDLEELKLSPAVKYYCRSALKLARDWPNVALSY